MASSPTRPRYNLILLGKTGSGKSASGNTILGKNGFISKKIFKSVTQDVKKERASFNDVTLDVYDTPGLFNTEISNERVLDEWKPLLQLDETICTVVLLVMKVDRFTLEDKKAVSLIEDFIPERLVPNTWILFSRGDELERGALTIEEFIEDTEELKQLVQRFQNRYHVFNNSSQSPDQVQTLIYKIKKTAQIISLEIGLPNPEDPLHRKIVLVGKTGVGKSATGNTILGEKRFRSELSSSSVTSKSEKQQDVVLNRTVSVIDTPGLFDTKLSHEQLAEEIGRSIYLSSPGPHAFLYVQPINIRFTEQEKNVIEKLEQIFGREMRRYTMVLFTYGDLLKEKSVDVIIQENSSLRRIVDQCGGGYHIFNNKHMRNREQVRELLQKINRMVEENGGTCYSNQMYEEAARLRREEEEERRREGAERLRKEEGRIRRREGAERLRREEERGDNIGFKEFYKRNKAYLLKAAAVGGGGGALFGASVGAAAGGAVGGPIGAGIGAAVGIGIGAAVGAAIGSGAGFGVGARFRKKKEQNNKRGPSTERETAAGSDGGCDSLDSFDEGTSESLQLMPNIRQRSRSGRSKHQD